MPKSSSLLLSSSSLSKLAQTTTWYIVAVLESFITFLGKTVHDRKGEGRTREALVLLRGITSRFSSPLWTSPLASGALFLSCAVTSFFLSTFQIPQTEDCTDGSVKWRSEAPERVHITIQLSKQFKIKHSPSVFGEFPLPKIHRSLLLLMGQPSTGLLVLLSFPTTSPFLLHLLTLKPQVPARTLATKQWRQWFVRTSRLTPDPLFLPSS